MAQVQYQNIFKRYEKKYLLTRRQYCELAKRLEPFMKPDKYGLSSICNIYFDTPDRLLIRRSLEKPIYKEKLRLRSYGKPGGNDTVFIELKKKYNGVVYKRRIHKSLTAAESYLYDRRPRVPSNQIEREIDYFLRFYNSIEPAMYISYGRIAMFSDNDPNLRITFDTDITWREYELFLESGSFGNKLLSPDTVLMEIKIPGIMPLWLSHMLDSLNIYPSSFSKYGRAYCASISNSEGRIISA